MKIAIGPVEGEYGGAAHHIRNLVEHSRLQYRLITMPSSLKASSAALTAVSERARRLVGIGLAHSDKRSDMYGVRRWVDLWGLLESRYRLRGYQVVHLHGHPYWERLYEVKGPRLVFTVHNLYDRTDFAPEWWPTVERLTASMINVCRRAHRVIAVAQWLRANLRESHGVDALYIPNGVNLNEMATANADRFRDKFGVSSPFYLFVGRATRYKRLEHFIAAACAMPSRQFVAIGRGVTDMGARTYYGSPLPPNLLCLGQPSRQDVVDAFAACQVFVLPSANETFGIVILEAMACGRPVVAAANRGPAEIIQHGQNGFLFEPDALSSLLQQLETAWAASDVGAAGQATARAHSWTEITPQVEAAYGDIY